MGSSFIISNNTIFLTEKVTLHEFYRILDLHNKEGYLLGVTDHCKQLIDTSANTVQQLAQEQIPTYGINTGFGELINVCIPAKDGTTLQHNLIKTHATGVGQPLSFGQTQAILLVRILNLIRGYSGVRFSTILRYIEMFNTDCFPVIQSQGSLGASGDLAPLSQLAYGIICDKDTAHDPACDVVFWMRLPPPNSEIGKVSFDLAYYHLHWDLTTPYQLTYKEGLALINGTSAMLGIALVANQQFQLLLSWALDTQTMTLAALKASDMPFSKLGNFMPVRMHLGQELISEAILDRLKDCQLITTHQQLQEEIRREIVQKKSHFEVTDDKQLISSEEFTQPIKTSVHLQRAYSLRCLPQVIGAIYDTWKDFHDAIENELQSTSDNPMIIGAEIFHGANFHGQYVANYCDYLKIAVIQLAKLLDRQIARLIDATYSEGLPSLLAQKQSGLQCAFEGMQYASTSVVAEMMLYATPASIQSISSNLNNQDFVSMGMIAARYLQQSLDDLAKVIAVEGICAAQALELRLIYLGVNPSTECSKNKEILGHVYAPFIRIRDEVPFLANDHHLDGWIQKVIAAYYKLKPQEWIQ